LVFAIRVRARDVHHQLRLSRAQPLAAGVAETLQILGIADSVRQIERGSKVLVAYADPDNGDNVRELWLMHAACLAIIERSALVTTAFTVLGKQVMHVRRNYRDRVDTVDGTPPMINQLVRVADHQETDDTEYWKRWTADYDYLYVLFTDANYENPDPANLTEIFAVGFSMGGNLVLKMAGELVDSPPSQICGFVAVAPALDLAACADALGEPRNLIYQRHFVRGLKRRMRLKTGLFPHIFPVDGMRNIQSVREFDEFITARFCGFAGADDYYQRSSALQLVGQIRKPCMILTSLDDPFVPISSFSNPAIRDNPCIELIITKHGGHCAFISNERGDARFWAENRVVDFCLKRSTLTH